MGIRILWTLIPLMFWKGMIEMIKVILHVILAHVAVLSLYLRNLAMKLGLFTARKLEKLSSGKIKGPARKRKALRKLF